MLYCLITVETVSGENYELVEICQTFQLTQGRETQNCLFPSTGCIYQETHKKAECITEEGLWATYDRRNKMAFKDGYYRNQF